MCGKVHRDLGDAISAPSRRRTLHLRVVAYGILAVWPLESLIPLEEEDEPSNIPLYLLVLIVVLVERADRQSAAGFGPIFLRGGKSGGSLSNVIFL